MERSKESRAVVRFFYEPSDGTWKKILMHAYVVDKILVCDIVRDIPKSVTAYLCQITFLYDCKDADRGTGLQDGQIIIIRPENVCRIL